MTDQLTDEAVKLLLAAPVADFDEDGQLVQALARALLDARAEPDRLAAELAAAQQREGGLLEALTLIERVYFLEEKDAAWKIARMNGIAREAQDGNDLTHYRRIFSRAALSHNGSKS